MIDGNKRLAWVAARLFVLLHAAELRAPDVDEGERLMVAVAAGNLEVPEITQVLEHWITAQSPA